MGWRFRAHGVRARAQYSGEAARSPRKDPMNDMTETLTPLRIIPNEEAVASTKIQISMRRLQFFYGQVHALRDVNLDVPANAVTSIIGPSGCGKSTLLRAINRIYEIYPDQRAEGEIVLDGENVLDRRYKWSALRRKVGMVFQKPTPFASSIRNNV